MARLPHDLRGYPKRPADLRASWPEYISVSRPHDKGEPEELPTLGNERWDNYPRGRPYLILHSHTEADRTLLIGIPSMKAHRERADVPLVFEDRSHALHITELLALPADHRAVVDFSWQRAGTTRSVECFGADEGRLYDAVDAALTESPVDAALEELSVDEPSVVARDDTTLPQGSLVDVEFVRGTPTICVTVSPRWVQRAVSKLPRIVVVQTISYEHGDEAHAPDLIVLDADLYRLRERRTIDCILLRTISPVDRRMRAIWRPASAEPGAEPTPPTVTTLSGATMDAFRKGIRRALGMTP